jgi:GNAT superfamily N-acetyltransferase
MKLEIRKLESHDELLLDEALVTFKGEPSPAPDLFLSDPRAHAYVALEEDRVVGWAYGHELLRPEGRWMMLLYEIEVTEEDRRRGVGRELLQTFVDFARSRGHLKMWLFTDAGDDAARRIYAGAGGDPDDRPVGYWWVFE